MWRNQNLLGKMVAFHATYSFIGQNIPGYAPKIAVPQRQSSAGAQTGEIMSTVSTSKSVLF